jgi:hypothetical protein
MRGRSPRRTAAGSQRDPADLERRLLRALDTAGAAIELVEHDVVIDLGQHEASPDKIIAETAMFLRTVVSIPLGTQSTVHRRATALLSRLAPLARRPRVRYGIALHPALARDYAAAHAVLHNVGAPDATLSAALSTAIASPASAARERVPHRELEQVWLDWLAGNGERPAGGLLDRTALGLGLDLLTGSRDDVYGLTHAILYATDFGGHAPELPRPRAEILAEARCALAGALDDDDFDLAGELLLAWPMLRADGDPTSAFAFDVLARVEDEVGVLPSLAIDRDGYDAHADGAARGQYVTATTYHTVYVMGLLCAATLRHAPRVEVPPGDDPGATRVAATLLGELGRDARCPQWWSDLDALEPGRRAALAPMLADIALRRAVRRLDLEAVRRVLSLSLACPGEATPLARQAAHLLRRVADISASARDGAERPAGVHVAVSAD